jgi:predicted NUDIX family phosphoesterase
MSNPQSQQQPSKQVHDEQILVIKRTDLFGPSSWHGIKSDNLQTYITRIASMHEFHPRSVMETDPTYKQVIPYIIFKHKNTYFLMQRRSNATEQRLKNKMSMGIGGHVRREDLQENDVVKWAMREFNEEVNYTGTFTVSLVGLLNDDSNAVGQVHVGLVMLFTGDSPDISIKSELKSGNLMTLDQCKEQYDALESWSQMAFDYLMHDGNHSCC